MSYQVLALKWRPKQFKDAVGQEAITQTLKNSILKNQVGHAYLLTGTRGIGKTTIARIFAKALRCENLTSEGEPCLSCGSCQSIENGKSLDVMEIDGASNNSVDDIKELIENVHYLPTSGKYKIYIIDEVHMLSVNAFNALLKTLEEPPKHVVFVFATTDPEKLLGTVLSRCLRFDFRNATEEILVEYLQNIVAQENLKFESINVPNIVASHASGSFRDALSIMDQIISLSTSDTILEKTVFMSLGMANTVAVNQMVDAIFRKDRDKVIQLYNSIIQENIEFKKFSIQVLDKIYSLITENNENPNDIAKISLVERMWIYENLLRDLDWSLSSISPLKSTSFVFIKLALREEILVPHASVEVKKKVDSQETVEVDPEEVETIISWEEFIKFVHTQDKLIAMNIERGNLISPSELSNKTLRCTVGFAEESKLFYDVLIEGDKSKKLAIYLKEYLQLQELPRVELKVLGEVEKEETNFKSSVDIEVEHIKDYEKALREEIKNNKFVVEAEQLFNAKVDKVVLKKQL